MNAEERLAAIVEALESVGLSSLIMSGHAVRFFGLQRYTNDFDLRSGKKRGQRWQEKGTTYILFTTDRKCTLYHSLSASSSFQEWPCYPSGVTRTPAAIRSNRSSTRCE